MRAEHAEVAATLLALNSCLEDLVVRGLRSAGGDDVRQLDQLAQSFRRAQANYLADLLEGLVRQTREGTPDPKWLLRTQTAARVFERVLSIEAAAEALGGPVPSPDAAPARPGVPGDDRTGLVPVLRELGDVVEGLVASGLTTASKATREKVDASAKEAARAKLGRLSASLRYVNDELGRFLSESPHFSARRLAFFLNRVWLIARGLEDAISEKDEKALARLLWQSTPTPVKALEVVTLGVQKRALLDGSASFDFRFRVVDGTAQVPTGTKLVWSTVFAGKKNVPAEAFLHLPQAQKFTPKLLLDPVRVKVTEAAVSLDDAGGGRLLLGPQSTGIAQKPFTDWRPFATWDPSPAVARLARHQVTPLDLEVELQEEIVLADYELGAPAPHPNRPELQVLSLTADERTFDATVSSGPEGEALLAALKGLRKKKPADRPPLYGLLHYDFCRLVFTPLSTLDDAGPTHLMISSDRIDLASLMKTLDFTT